MRGPRYRQPRLAARWLLAAALLLGCSSPEGPGLQRWIADDPEETLAVERGGGLPELGGGPWKVPLGDDYRNALLAFSGDALDRDFQVPDDGRLRLEVGVVCGGPGTTFRSVAPVTIEALLQRPQGDPETLWEARFEVGDEARAARWTEEVIDLREHAGRRVRLSLRASLAEPPGRAPCAVAFANPEVTGAGSRVPGPNVILISVDTLRAGRLSLYGNERETSPRIDEWARRRGTTFATTVAQAAWTLPSHVSMLTGLDALRHGVNFNAPAPASLTFVAEVFRRAGYATVALTGGGWMSPEYGFSQGFDRYASWRDRDGEEELERNMDRFLEWLASHRDRPFFALFHTYEPHGPYLPRQPWFDRFYDGPLADRPEAVAWRPPRENSGVVERRVELVWEGREGEAPPPEGEVHELAKALYDSGVAHADAQVGRLLDRLRELDLESRTIVVLTSDHGEALGEHGGLQGHGYAYDHNLLVPLVIAAPGLDAAGRTVEHQVRLVDLAPTLLELAGLPPLPDVDGRSLVPAMQGDEDGLDREAWSYTPKGNWGVVLRLGGRLKYHRHDSPWTGLRGEESLYRLDRDPDELNDIAGEDPDAERLRRRVLERMETVPALRVRLSAAPGERVRGRLRGGLAQPQKVKTLDMPCDCLRWVPPGSVEFVVPPGTTYEVLFQDPAGDAVRVEGLQIEGRPAVRPLRSLRLTLDDLREARALSLTSDGWDLTSGAVQSRATGLTFRWTGGAGLAARDPSEEDPELTQRLRALGYVQ